MQTREIAAGRREIMVSWAIGRPVGSLMLSALLFADPATASSGGWADASKRYNIPVDLLYAIAIARWLRQASNIISSYYCGYLYLLINLGE